MNCKINQEVWFDYVEGELDASFKKDLSLHLKDCTECQKSYAELQFVKRVLKSDKVGALAKDLPTDAFFAKLENKIMASLDKKTEADVVPLEFSRPFWVRRFAIPMGAAAALFVMVLGSLFTTPAFKSSNSSFARQELMEEQLIEQTASTNPQFFGDSMITHQDEDDLVLDAAAEKLSRMSDTEARTMLDNMK